MLSVVIPVFNEEVRLEQSLRAVGEYLRHQVGNDFEIIHSDDGSSDRSISISESLQGELPVKILRAPQNQGKGAAVSRGMLAAAGDPVFFFDADLSTPLDEMAGFLQRLDDGQDVVIGTRKHPDADIQRPQPWHRVQLGLAYTRLVNLMTGLRFSDYTCGFKAFRRDAAQQVFRRSRIYGWSFDAEILFLSQRLGYAVQEVPVRWLDCPDSRVRLAQDIAGSFWELVKIRGNAWRGVYQLREGVGR